jgi:hypothetical protein
MYLILFKKHSIGVVFFGLSVNKFDVIFGVFSGSFTCCPIWFFVATFLLVGQVFAGVSITG